MQTDSANKISDHEMLKITIKCEGKRNRNTSSRHLEKFKYDQQEFSNELSAILDYHDNIGLDRNVLTPCFCKTNSSKTNESGKIIS